MKRPFFSVIVPAHNSERFIRTCLHSIRQQTFKDYELIVVCDDCSDDTARIALGYADKIITTHFGTDGLARNAGIDAAVGEWIVFLDDDDWWLHEFVLDELKAAALEDRDMLVFDFIWKSKGYRKNTAFEMNIAVWSKAFRRDLIGNTRFPGIRSTSDSPFMHEIIEKRPRIHAMNQLMYYYNYMREGSQTWSENAENGGNG